MDFRQRRLQVRQHAFQRPKIDGINHHTLTQTTFPLARFFCQYVAFIRLKADKLASSGAFKTFGCPSVSFYFWHYYILPGKLCIYNGRLLINQVASISVPFRLGSGQTDRTKE